MRRKGIAMIIKITAKQMKLSNTKKFIPQKYIPQISSTYIRIGITTQMITELTT